MAARDAHPNPCLFSLPNEVLYAVTRRLGLAALLAFCTTCRDMRHRIDARLVECRSWERAGIAGMCARGNGRAVVFLLHKQGALAPLVDRTVRAICSLRHPDAIDALFAARPNMLPAHQNVVLQSVIAYGSPECIARLRSHGLVPTLAHVRMAVSAGVFHLIAQDIDADALRLTHAEFSIMANALHVAVERGHNETVEAYVRMMPRHHRNSPELCYIWREMVRHAFLFHRYDIVRFLHSEVSCVDALTVAACAASAGNASAFFEYVDRARGLLPCRDLLCASMPDLLGRALLGGNVAIAEGTLALWNDISADTAHTTTTQRLVALPTRDAGSIEMALWIAKHLNTASGIGWRACCQIANVAANDATRALLLLDSAAAVMSYGGCDARVENDWDTLVDIGATRACMPIIEWVAARRPDFLRSRCDYLVARACENRDANAAAAAIVYLLRTTDAALVGTRLRPLLPKLSANPSIRTDTLTRLVASCELETAEEITCAREAAMEITRSHARVATATGSHTIGADDNDDDGDNDADDGPTNIGKNNTSDGHVSASNNGGDGCLSTGENGDDSNNWYFTADERRARKAACNIGDPTELIALCLDCAAHGESHAAALFWGSKLSRKTRAVPIARAVVVAVGLRNIALADALVEHFPECVSRLGRMLQRLTAKKGTWCTDLLAVRFAASYLGRRTLEAVARLAAQHDQVSILRYLEERHGIDHHAQADKLMASALDYGALGVAHWLWRRRWGRLPRGALAMRNGFVRQWIEAACAASSSSSSEPKTRAQREKARPIALLASSGNMRSLHDDRDDDAAAATANKRIKLAGPVPLRRSARLAKRERFD